MIRENGVAVMTSAPNKRVRTRIGIASRSVTSATNGVDIAYPIHPPPSLIAVAPVLMDVGLMMWIKAVELKIRSNEPIVIRPVAALSSGARKSRSAK